MLLAHAVTLAEARTHLAALADRARTFAGSVEYERLLLELDSIHGDQIPGISPVAVEPDVSFSVAESAIARLVVHGVDSLRIELLLAMLDAAQATDAH